MRTKIFIGLAVLTGLIFLFDGEISAHGTGYKHSELKAAALEFMYSTGEKMSYCKAEVFSPKDEKFAFQSGRTDEQGRFSFVPDSEGTWKVTVRDEEGHQCTAEINITPEKNVNVNADNQGGLLVGTEILIRSLLGVSIIFNIAMLIYRKGKS